MRTLALERTMQQCAWLETATIDCSIAQYYRTQMRIWVATDLAEQRNSGQGILSTAAPCPLQGAYAVEAAMCVLGCAHLAMHIIPNVHRTPTYMKALHRARFISVQHHTGLPLQSQVCKHTTKHNTTAYRMGYLKEYKHKACTHRRWR
jgi:hypothetical protein